MSAAIAMAGIDDHTHEITGLLREGRSDKRIAKRLGISRDEVQRVIANLISTARLDDEAHVEVLVERLGLGPSDD